jgi:hypothetical protein
MTANVVEATGTSAKKFALPVTCAKDTCFAQEGSCGGAGDRARFGIAFRIKCM